MSSAAPLCPVLTAAYQQAATIVISLVLGLLPRRGGKSPDTMLVNLVVAGQKTGQAIPLAMLHADDLAAKQRGALALEAAVLRAMAGDVALWLPSGGSPAPAAAIPEALLPNGEVVELLAALTEARAKDADDPFVLGAEALDRWNTVLATLTDPTIWLLVCEVAKLCLSRDKITPEKLDAAIDAVPGAAEVLGEYEEVLVEVLEARTDEPLTPGPAAMTVPSA